MHKYKGNIILNTDIEYRLSCETRNCTCVANKTNPFRDTCPELCQTLTTYYNIFSSIEPRTSRLYR